MMTKSFTAYIEYDAESGMYIGKVPTIPGAHTFAETLDGLQIKLKEVVALCLEELTNEEVEQLPVFTGVTPLEVTI
jgi:predicted RNase H-like HicB family nuclease